MIKKVKTLLKENYKEIIMAFIVLVFMSFYMLFYIGHNLGGEYNWITLPSEKFGMPNEIKEYYHTEPIYGEDYYAGWDGQFYYYISNDILGWKGYREYVDSPSYRWQRIGLPFLAKILSLILLRKNVSILVYTFTSILLVTCSVFISCKYFKEKREKYFWIVPWLLSCGVIITIRHGLPDAAADALFIIAFIMLLKKKYYFYSLFMTVTCLTREGYVLIAFCVFILFLLNGLEKFKIFEKGKLYIGHFFTIAFPGIIFLIWYGYVTIYFGAFPFKQAHNITQMFLTSWWQYFIQNIRNGNSYEIIGLLIYIFFIIISLIVAWVLGKKERLFLTLIPYIILVGSFGSTVMGHYSGYLKGISILYFLLPFMVLHLDEIFLSFIKKDQSFLFNITEYMRKIMGLFLLFITVASLCIINRFQNNLLRLRYRGDAFNQEIVSEKIEALNNFSSEIEIEDYQYLKYKKVPEIFVKPYAIYTIRIKNTSNEIWSHSANKDGRGAVHLSYKWIQNEKTVIEGMRHILEADVQPGEEIFRDMYIEYPLKDGEYILRISLVQEGIAWFFDKNGAYIDLNIKIGE